MVAEDLLRQLFPESVPLRSAPASAQLEGIDSGPLELAGVAAGGATAGGGERIRLIARVDAAAHVVLASARLGRVFRHPTKGPGGPALAGERQLELEERCWLLVPRGWKNPAAVERGHSLHKPLLPEPR